MTHVAGSPAGLSVRFARLQTVRVDALPRDLPVTPTGDRTSASRALPVRPGRLHVHRFHRTGDDVFSGGSLYRCRCGVVRAGF